MRANAFTGAAIDGELAAHTQAVRDDPQQTQFDGDTPRLTKVYLWYAGDFIQAADGISVFACRYMPALADRLAAGKPPRLRWIAYDWTLNALK